MNIQEAKQIKIADYLQSLGYSPVKQQGNCLWYKSPFRQETEASFKVNTDRNLWFDYGLVKQKASLTKKMSISCDCNMKKLLTHGQMSVQNGMIYT